MLFEKLRDHFTPLLRISGDVRLMAEVWKDDKLFLARKALEHRLGLLRGDVRIALAVH